MGGSRAPLASYRVKIQHIEDTLRKERIFLTGLAGRHASYHIPQVDTRPVSQCSEAIVMSLKEFLLVKLGVLPVLIDFVVCMWNALIQTRELSG